MTFKPSSVSLAALFCYLSLLANVSAQTDANVWDQWRGPHRDGVLQDFSLPDSISDTNLQKVWEKPLQPSYSGPIVVGDQLFVTETKDKKFEVVKCLNLKTGEQKWETQWEGAMTVPFFAAANGSWIRSTPAFSDGILYVAGMKDVLVAIDGKTGQQKWKRDFPTEEGTAVPSFGFVCSPMIDGDFLYVQAGGGLLKLKKDTGETVWKALADGGGMYGSAFSSPVIEEVNGKRQLVVQTRAELCGVDIETGSKLWGIAVKSFRGMNILTPTFFEGSVFTSTYGGTTQLIGLDSGNPVPKWSLPIQGYMSSPVIIDNYAYLHLRNQRYACFDLKEGKETWRSKPFGKYASLIAAGDKILALDASGELLLIKANPNEFELLDSRTVGDDSWAHLAMTNQNVVVRNLKQVAVYKWVDGTKP
ncbi:MAG: PQQ-binding-like beta-propeller repeat protein [Planctomycetota bacterium]